MAELQQANPQRLAVRLNKVPDPTTYFWVIKVLATTVGETAADYLASTLGLGLVTTTIVMGLLLVIALVVQFRARRYSPTVYWIAVVLISVFGTLLTDNLTDNLGVSLVVTTTVFAIALAVTFTVWHKRERTLSIHSIDTSRREAFYWVAILLTFALGTAAGDLIAEQLSLGYLASLGIFAGAIALVAVTYRASNLNSVAAFWIAYVLTRPLGASLGDLLAQTHKGGGLGFGTTTTSVIFLAAIVSLIVTLTLQQRRAQKNPPAVEGHPLLLAKADGSNQ